VYDAVRLDNMDLPFDADESEIKRRFRQLAKIHHPDAGGDAGRFIELMELYRKLINKA
jgi:curved DNA-binding protein